MGKELDNKQSVIIDYLKKHRHATTRDIKRITKIKIERVFDGGIREAYKLAHIGLPQHLRKRSKEECKKLVMDYIKNRRTATVSEIQSKLKVNISRLFESIKQAYKYADIRYPRERNFEKMKQVIIERLKENPLYSQTELEKMFHTNISKLFGSFKNLCKLADVEFLRFQKRKLKKQQQIIDYIKKNPNATQWEINKKCRTHVQELFKDGIREAFSKAGVRYPDSERILYGTAKFSIRKRSLLFQDRAVSLLRNFGDVRTQVKVKNGIVDAIFNFKGSTLPVEIKDYRTKPISKTEIMQLLKYMKDLDCKRGLIISYKGVRKEFNIDSNKLIVIPVRELENYFGVVV